MWLYKENIKDLCDNGNVLYFDCIYANIHMCYYSIVLQSITKGETVWSTRLLLLLSRVSRVQLCATP